MPWWLQGLALLWPLLPATALDLGAARSWRLDNGLTVLVLEDRTLPVASVQMLYRVGARNDDSGRIGLAHFLEHMAFRATENFPGTGVVSSIYAVGGEWHGYTWIDQTTYFETLPAAELDLALRIEADRMARLVIAPEEVAAERGAVLAELHGYENDPATVLRDAVAATAFLQHPYRNNTLGWESDVAAIGHDDLVAFYRTHYAPANAVLAVAGDVSADAVRSRVAALFDGFPSRAPTPPVRTVEPAQRGERRVMLMGPPGSSRFEIAWVAPGAADADYPAFLLLQEILAGGSGVNFRQSDGTTPVGADSLLGVAAGDGRELETWLPPAEFRYLFSIAGTARPGDDEQAVEAAVERAVAALREREVTRATLAAARERVLAELVFDVETTEDAAHELAYFAGLNALDARLTLPARVAMVSATEVRAVAQRYLGPAQRTIGWHRAGAASEPPPSPAAVAPRATAPRAEPGRASAARGAPSAPQAGRLPGGLPAITQRVPLSPAAQVAVVLPGTDWDVPASLQAAAPTAGHTTLGVRCLPADVGGALERLRDALARLQPLPARDGAASPEAAIAATIGRAAGLRAASAAPPARAALVTVVGDVDVRATQALLRKAFADVSPAPAVPAVTLPAPAVADVRIRFEGPAAQAQIGYVVAAPAPGERDALAWQLALYVLSHGYEGRLGLEAINRRGLAYYIDARYDSDGARAWIGLTAGVDPGKLAAFEQVLRAELRRLVEQPPDAGEIAEARRHFVGREQTAAQSNAEIAAELARQWLWHGKLRAPGELARALAAVSDADVLRVLPALAGGTVLTVEIAQ